MMPPAYLSSEDYLPLEREAAHKHAYCAGEIRAMAGAKSVHNRLYFNLI